MLIGVNLSTRLNNKDSQSNCFTNIRTVMMRISARLLLLLLRPYFFKGGTLKDPIMVEKAVGSILALRVSKVKGLFVVIFSFELPLTLGNLIRLASPSPFDTPANLPFPVLLLLLLAVVLKLKLAKRPVARVGASLVIAGAVELCLRAVTPGINADGFQVVFGVFVDF